VSPYLSISILAQDLLSGLHYEVAAAVHLAEADFIPDTFHCNSALSAIGTKPVPFKDQGVSLIARTPPYSPRNIAPFGTIPMQEYQLSYQVPVPAHFSQTASPVRQSSAVQ